MHKKTLPTFYYLDHFKEFLRYFEGANRALLHRDAETFIAFFQQAPLPIQATIARLANRKHSVIALSRFVYDEIPEIKHHLGELKKLGWVAPLSKASVDMLILALSKSELFLVLDTLAIPCPKKSIKRDDLNQYFFTHVDENQLNNLDALPYIVRQFDDVIGYLLFVYFGHLRGKLNQFSMRDLGIMHTRADAVTGEAKFDSCDDAQAAFCYAKLRQQIAQSSLVDTLDLTKLPRVTSIEGYRIRDKCLFELGRYFLAQNRPWALTAWAMSGSDNAMESWIREQYKDNNKDKVKAKLLSIIDTGSSESLLYFAEDFYARKFNKKRTSLLTDMLRQATRCLTIDSRYNQQVEQGVISYYRRNGIKAIRSENQLWRALFALLFWPILYEQDKANLGNEFERIPPSLKSNQFYTTHKTAIDLTLVELSNKEAFFKRLVQHVALYFGKPNALFIWRTDLLDNVKLLLDHAPVDAILQQLTAMAKDFAGLSDGYPDIMVVEDNRLRFEEIKAPGDCLRRNQLITLQKLKHHGFDVQITQVEWFRDPEQIYAVVDIETTGSKSQHHRITEIGIVKMQGTRVIETWQSLVNPQRRIPSAITRLTGITNDMVADAPVFSELADKIESVTENAIFVAHNVNFDLGFIKQEFARLDRIYRRPKLCTVQQSRRTFPNLSSYSLAKLSEHFDINMDCHHRALSDAKAAAAILSLILESEAQ